jgi:hypothetical protein
MRKAEIEAACDRASASNGPILFRQAAFTEPACAQALAGGDEQEGGRALRHQCTGRGGAGVGFMHRSGGGCNQMTRPARSPECASFVALQ